MIEKCVTQFLDNHDTKNHTVCASLAGRRTLGRFVDLPAMKAKKATEVISFEARQQFPVDMDQLTWDYAFLNQDDVNASLKD